MQNVTNEPVTPCTQVQHNSRILGSGRVDLPNTEVAPMILATLVMICALPQAAVVRDLPADSTAAIETAKNLVPSASKLPESPAPKLERDAAVPATKLFDAASPEPSASPAIQPASRTPLPIKPALTRGYENSRDKKIWYGLMAVSHGAAAFDAWSTRRAVAGGYGTEANPFLRAASHSNMIYAATQVSPAVMDLIGRKMMTSQNRWIRRFWWLPQAAGTGLSISAGVHNTSLVP